MSDNMGCLGLIIIALVIGFISNKIEACKKKVTDKRIELTDNEKRGFFETDRIREVDGITSRVYDNELAFLGYPLNVDVSDNRVLQYALAYDANDNLILHPSKAYDYRWTKAGGFRYYSYNAADLACRSIGWRLPTKNDMKRILKYRTGDTSKGEYRFDPVRAYGAMPLPLAGVYRADEGYKHSDKTSYEALYSYGRYGTFWLKMDGNIKHVLESNKQQATLNVYKLNPNSTGSWYPCYCVKDI